MSKNLTVSTSERSVAVTVWPALVVPTATLPKLRLLGTSCSCAFPGKAKTGVGAARLAKSRRAKLKTESIPMVNRGRDMVGPPKNCGLTGVLRKPHHRTTTPSSLRIARSIGTPGPNGTCSLQIEIAFSTRIERVASEKLSQTTLARFCCRLTKAGLVKRREQFWKYNLLHNLPNQRRMKPGG